MEIRFQILPNKSYVQNFLENSTIAEFLDWMTDSVKEDSSYNNLSKFHDHVHELFRVFFDPMYSHLQYTFQNPRDPYYLVYTINATFTDEKFDKQKFDDSVTEFKIALNCEIREISKKHYHNTPSQYVYSWITWKDIT